VTDPNHTHEWSRSVKGEGLAAMVLQMVMTKVVDAHETDDSDGANHDQTKEGKGHGENAGMRGRMELHEAESEDLKR
jgi:hypothetical protein